MQIEVRGKRSAGLTTLCLLEPLNLFRDYEVEGKIYMVIN